MTGNGVQVTEPVELDDAIRALMERGIPVPTYDLERLGRALRGDGSGGLRLEELSLAAEEAQEAKCHDLGWVLGRAEHRRLVLWQVTHPVLVVDEAGPWEQVRTAAAAEDRRLAAMAQGARFFREAKRMLGATAIEAEAQGDVSFAPGRLVIGAMAAAVNDPEWAREWFERLAVSSPGGDFESAGAWFREWMRLEE